MRTRLRIALALAIAWPAHAGGPVDAGAASSSDPELTLLTRCGFGAPTPTGPKPPMSRREHCAQTKFDASVIAPLFKTHQGSPSRVTSPDGCWVAQAIYSGAALVRLEQWLPGDDGPAVEWEYDTAGGVDPSHLTVGTDGIADFFDDTLHRKTVHLGPNRTWRAIHEHHDPNLATRVVTIIEREGLKVSSRRTGWDIESPRRFNYGPNNPY
jgi:hypothetical protein